MWSILSSRHYSDCATNAPGFWKGQEQTSACCHSAPVMVPKNMQKDERLWNKEKVLGTFGIPATIQLYLFDYTLLGQVEFKLPILASHNLSTKYCISIQTPEFSEVELKSLTFHSSLIPSPPNSAFNKEKKMTLHSLSVAKKTNFKYMHIIKKIKIWKLKYFIS